MALEAAMADMASEETQQVPDHLKDASYRGAKDLGHGVGYKYTHEHPDEQQEFMRKKKKYYNAERDRKPITRPHKDNPEKKGGR
jgi:putative ATPase